MFITALALVAAFSPPQTRLHLTLPPEIADAVGPYRDCKLQAVGATVTSPDGKRLAKLVKKGGDCSVYRTKAIADADAVLVKLGKPDADRAAMIAKAVQDVDTFAAELKRAMN